jgi:hypothetical protein
MTSTQIEQVFDLVEKVSNLPKSLPDDDDEITGDGAHHPHGDGKEP